ncbi:MAG: acyl-CoA synthetase [Deltaproteobacteria bacterium]|nr:acyl-CoA synthetase [Deltaproteobacteria bacterium]
MDWNFADLFELVADTVPDRRALAHGVAGPTRTWRELDRNANALARHLARSHQPNDKLAIYAYNRPEFIETLLAALKARLVPVNVNYRYREEELVYLLDNADATAVVYEAEFADRIAKVRDRLPKVREWIEIQDGDAAGASAIPYQEIVGAGTDERLDVRRDPADLIFMYTGGTTGMPKGVMWEHRALYHSLGGGGNVVLGEKASESPAEHAGRVAQEGRAQRLLPACPLMHGTGLFTALNALGGGGTIVTSASKALDAEELWSTVEARGVNACSIVGDAFAKPMLKALQENPGRWDLSKFLLMVSSGVMWSPPVKQALLEHIPHALLYDSFGSSEAVGFGVELTTKTSTVSLGKFRIGPNCKVFTPEGKEVEPGSGEPGFIARSGPIPLGYYKDEKKSAETFKTYQDRRWSIPGDWCTVNADGTIVLHGRGSVCINTAGEKVYPEEVEEALKTHPAVADAIVVGVPDEKWGEAVTGVVRLEAGRSTSEQELRTHVRERLAGYKTPKRIVFSEATLRAPNGKADYKGAKALALGS